MLEYNVSKTVWVHWAKRAKAYGNKRDGRSFAQVIKSNVPRNNQLKTQNISNIAKKIKSTAKNNQVVHSRILPKSHKQKDSHTLSLTNRFQILALNDTELEGSAMAVFRDPLDVTVKNKTHPFKLQY